MAYLPILQILLILCLTASTLYLSFVLRKNKLVLHHTIRDCTRDMNKLYLLQQKEIQAYLQSILRIIVEQKKESMSPPKFVVGDKVKVVCDSQNFIQGWHCLGTPFVLDHDEEGVIATVDIDYSYLEELLVGNYLPESFPNTWLKQYGKDIQIEDIGTPRLKNAIVLFVQGINLAYVYKLDYTNPAIGVKWSIAEKFLEPLLFEHGRICLE